jgi:hypothetical protein
MIRKAILVAAVAFCSTSAFSASFIFSPQSQTTSQACTINLGAGNFANAIGLDIEIVFDADIVRCTSVEFVTSALPGFSEFYRQIDNDGGSLEIVLLKHIFSGYSGGADSFLVLTFEPVSSGTAKISIVRSYQNGDPLLLDLALASIETAVDTAEVIVDLEPPPPVITVTKLHQNFPNPFNPATTVRFDVSARSAVRLKIFDVNGRLIRTLIDGAEYGNGRWDKEWDGRNDGGKTVQSGIYICVFEAGGQRMSSKLVLLR